MSGRRAPLGCRLTGLALLAGCAGAPDAPWRELFDGVSLAGWRPTPFGGEGEVVVRDGALHLGFGSPLTGVTWQGPPPEGAYEFEITAARVAGTDFFCGLTFPVGDAWLTLVLGGWGGSVCGLSSLDGRDAARNETRTLRAFANGVDHTARVTVTADEVVVALDEAPLLRAGLAGRALSLRPEVELSRPLGVAAFATEARITRVRWRPLHAP